MIGGISFSATSITSGLDADKPISPKPGNQYLATDTKILYVCYDAGVWVEAAPPIPDLIIATKGDTYLLKAIIDEKTERVTNGVWTTLNDFTVTGFTNISAVKSFKLLFDRKVANASYISRIRLLVNDVLIGSDYGN